jgi:predicted transcriptional regulator
MAPVVTRMTKNPSLPKPTEAELAILRVLWPRGHCTVRQVWEQLNRRQPTGYTTVLKMMQIMTAKGLLRRAAAGRSHRYAAARPQTETQRQLVRHLLERAFDGSAPQLVMQALAAKPATAAELAEIRALLREWERNSR